MTPTQLDLADLKAKAERALSDSLDGKWFKFDALRKVMNSYDAEFALAASPATILSLIAEVDRAPKWVIDLLQVGDNLAFFADPHDPEEPHHAQLYAALSAWKASAEEARKHTVSRSPKTTGHLPECWGRTSYSDEMAHCYCPEPVAEIERRGQGDGVVEDYIGQWQDRAEGLEADLRSAVLVAWKRGAYLWCSLNYPSWLEWLRSCHPDIPAAPPASAPDPRVVEVLRPFARYCDLNDLSERHPNDVIDVPVGDLLRAAALLAEIEGAR